MKIQSVGFFAPKVAPSFTGCTTLFTDFDATYFPFKRKDISQKNSQKFSQMYLPFDTFQRSEKEKGNDFDIIVTTGRSKNDFLHTQELIKRNGLDYCEPQGLISSNGANFFVFNGSETEDVTLDSCGIDLFPDISRLIKEMDPNISVVECKINGDKKTYGEYSSEFELEKLDEEARQKYASIARDGKTNLEIVFPKSVDDVSIASSVRKFIVENNYPFTVEHYQNSPFTRAVQYRGKDKTIEGANLLLIKQKRTEDRTDKFDTIKDKVISVIDEDKGDIVIVAGDAFNDEKMLNPLNYVDIFGVDAGNKTTQEILQDRSIISALNALPFKAIICGDNPDLDNLRELADGLDEIGVHVIYQAPDTIRDYPAAVGKILESN